MWARSCSPTRTRVGTETRRSRSQASASLRRLAGLRRLERDPVHLEEQVARRPLDPALGGERAVEPDLGLEPVELVEVAAASAASSYRRSRSSSTRLEVDVRRPA